MALSLLAGRDQDKDLLDCLTVVSTMVPRNSKDYSAAQFHLGALVRELFHAPGNPRW